MHAICEGKIAKIMVLEDQYQGLYEDNVKVKAQDRTFKNAREDWKMLGGTGINENSLRVVVV